MAAPTQQTPFPAHRKAGDSGKTSFEILPGNREQMKMESIREKTIRGLQVGDTFSIVRSFTEDDIEQFRGITRDHNPVHSDGRFIEAKNLKGQICHGLLVGSMATEIGGQIGWLASSLRLDFKKPVYVNDVVTCRLTITSINESLKAEATLEWRNQHHEIVLTAHLKGILPTPEERRILQSIMQGEAQERGDCNPPPDNIRPKAGA